MAEAAKLKRQLKLMLMTPFEHAMKKRGRERKDPVGKEKDIACARGTPVEER